MLKNVLLALDHWCPFIIGKPGKFHKIYTKKDLQQLLFQWEEGVGVNDFFVEEGCCFHEIHLFLSC